MKFENRIRGFYISGRYFCTGGKSVLSLYIGGNFVQRHFPFFDGNIILCPFFQEKNLYYNIGPSVETNLSPVSQQVRHVRNPHCWKPFLSLWKLPNSWKIALASINKQINLIKSLSHTICYTLCDKILLGTRVEIGLSAQCCYKRRSFGWDRNNQAPTQ
jgi:hypothetical protein